MSNVPKLRFREFTDELTKAKMGALFSKGKEKGFAGLPIYSVTVDRGLVPRDSLDRHMANDADDHLNQVVDVGDLAYNTMRMWQGAAGIAEEKCMVSPAYVVARPKSGVASKLFYYWFDNARMRYLLWAYSYGLTSDRLRLYFDDFAKIPVSIPKYSEQQKIADFLTSVDTKIEQLTRKEELLKQYKKGVMQKIFSQEIRFKADDGSEFPNWKLTFFSEIMCIPEKEKLLPVDRSKIITVKLHLKGVVRNENTENLSLGSTYYKRKAGQFLYGKQNLFNGAFGLIPAELNNFATSGDIPALEFYPNCYPEFVVTLLSRESFYKKLEGIASGTGSKRIHEHTFLSIKAELPSKSEQKKIADFIATIDEKVNLAAQEICQMTAFKKGLLQQMFV